VSDIDKTNNNARHKFTMGKKQVVQLEATQRYKGNKRVTQETKRSVSVSGWKMFMDKFKTQESSTSAFFFCVMDDVFVYVFLSHDDTECVF
jgi:hypothetical protein